jgi:Putative beta-barrel porin-2, OmpL-like. bbp2
MKGEHQVCHCSVKATSLAKRNKKIHGDHVPMKKQFGMAVATGIVVLGFAVQNALHAQNTILDSREIASSSEANSPSPREAAAIPDASASGKPSPDSAQAPGPEAVPAAPAKPSPGFFTRMGWAYLADWTGITPIDPNAPKRRGTDPPIPSPPYPASDWPIGGTQEIGAPDYQTYMLQSAIDGDPLRLSRIKWYGWAAIGANGSTNNRGNPSKGIAANAPSAYDVYPNTIVLDQLAIYTERLADTTQTDHFDWGFRITNLYGQDYRYTTSHGILSQQLLVKNAQYGYDPVMVYVDLYLPKLGQGADLRFGRYVSLPDIEAQLAPNNYSYSHSILYTYDCYTMVGSNLTVKINDHWTLQGGISPGCDTAPWTHDAKLTGNACAVYTWNKGGDALNTCDNTINDGKYAYNNLTAFYITWYHSISPHWHTDTEAWYQYMRDTPNMWWINTALAGETPVPYNSVTSPWPENVSNNRFLYPGGPDSAPTTPSTLNFGAVCENPNTAYTGRRATYCYAPEWAITNYVEHNFWNNTASLNIRSEIVDDIKGQRTGTPAIYEEHMVGFDFWAGTSVTFRPELSYTHAFSPYGLRALDIQPGSSVSALENAPINQLPKATMKALGAKTQALTLAADLIWHF